MPFEWLALNLCDLLQKPMRPTSPLGNTTGAGGDHVGGKMTSSWPKQNRRPARSPSCDLENDLLPLTERHLLRLLLNATDWTAMSFVKANAEHM